MKRFFSSILIILALASPALAWNEQEDVYDLPEADLSFEFDAVEPDYSHFETEELIELVKSPSTSDMESVYTQSDGFYRLEVSKDVRLDNLTPKFSILPFVDDDYRTDRGLTAKFNYKRASLGFSYSQRAFSGFNAVEDRLFVSPELKLTKNLSIKSKLAQTVDAGKGQSTVGFSYKYPNNNRDLEFEVKTSAIYKERAVDSRRVEFVTKFKI